MGLEHALTASAQDWLGQESLSPERAAALEHLVRSRSRLFRRRRMALAAGTVVLAGGLALLPAIGGLAASVKPIVREVVRFVIPRGTPVWTSGGPVIALDVEGRRSDYGADLWFDYRGYEVRDGQTWMTLGIHGTSRAPQRVKEDFSDWVVVDKEGGRYQPQVSVHLKQSTMTVRVGAVITPATLRAGLRATVQWKDEVIEMPVPAVGSEVRVQSSGGPVVDMTATGRRSQWGDDLWFQYEGRSVKDGFTVLHVRIPDTQRASERVREDFLDWVVLGSDGQAHDALFPIDTSQPGWMHVRLEGDVTPVRLRVLHHIQYRMVTPNLIRKWASWPSSEK